MILAGKSEALGEKSVPLPLQLPKIPGNPGSEAGGARREADRNRLSYDYVSYNLNKVCPLKRYLKCVNAEEKIVTFAIIQAYVRYDDFKAVSIKIADVQVQRRVILQIGTFYSERKITRFSRNVFPIC